MLRRFCFAQIIMKAIYASHCGSPFFNLGTLNHEVGRRDCIPKASRDRMSCRTPLREVP